MRGLAGALVVAVLLAGPGWAAGKERGNKPFASLPQTRPLSAEELEALTDEMTLRMTEVRELELPGPVAKAVRTRRELRELLESKLDEEAPREELDRWTEAYEALGLIAGGTDLRSVMVAVIGEQLAGAYDTDSETVYLVVGTPAMLIRPVLVHELTHAAQDVHFDLDSLPVDQKENDDLALAVTALVEGDATAVMLDFVLGRDTSTLPKLQERLDSGPQAAGSPELATAPRFLQEALVFPYVAGLRLVSELRRQGGWERVNAAYDDFPVSTEQVLHPEKFCREKDVPQRVVFPEGFAVPGEAVLLVENVLGEFGVGQLLKEFTTTEEALAASAGWDGDSFQVWRRRPLPTPAPERAGEGEAGEPAWVIVLLTTWDTPEDAREFYGAYGQLVANKYRENEELAGEESGRRRWRTERDLVELVLRGNDVLVVEGLREEERESLWRSLLDYGKSEFCLPVAEAAASD